MSRVIWAMKAAERYRKLVEMHPNEYWSVYLTEATDIIEALIQDMQPQPPQPPRPSDPRRPFRPR